MIYPLIKKRPRRIKTANLTQLNLPLDKIIILPAATEGTLCFPGENFEKNQQAAVAVGEHIFLAAWREILRVACKSDVGR